MCVLFPKKDRDDSVARALHQLKGSVYPTGMGWMAGWGPLGHLYGKRYWTPGLPGVTRKRNSTYYINKLFLQIGQFWVQKTLLHSPVVNEVG